MKTMVAVTVSPKTMVAVTVFEEDETASECGAGDEEVGKIRTHKYEKLWLPPFSSNVN